MNIHKNASRLVESLSSCRWQADRRCRPPHEAAGVCPRTIRKWVARYAVEGVATLLRSKPLLCPERT